MAIYGGELCPDCFGVADWPPYPVCNTCNPHTGIEPCEACRGTGWLLMPPNTSAGPIHASCKACDGTGERNGKFQWFGVRPPHA